MSLKALAKLCGAPAAKTHNDRLMVLSHVADDAMPFFLDNLETKDPTGWMRTLMTIDALDLGDMLKAQPRDEHRKIRQEWAATATAFVEFVGKGAVLKPSTADRMRDGDEKPWVSFTKSLEVIAVFNQASDRLVNQARDINVAGVHTLLDGKFNREDAVTGALSLWISMACALDQPETVKKLIDAFPNGMTAATRLASKCLKTIKFRDNDKAFGTSIEEQCFVSPFLVALHVGSMGSMEVIMAKRAEMGKSLDVPILSLYDQKENHRLLTQGETLNQLKSAAVPHVLVQAMLPILNGDQSALLNVVEDQLGLVEKNPDLFHTLTKAGVLHRGSSTAIMNCLERGIWHAPKAIPEFLEGMDWSLALPRFASNASPIFRSVQQIDKQTAQNKREREDAVLSLMSHANTLGHTDMVLQTFIGRDPFTTKAVLSPVTELSAAGFERALVAYLDHGFDPKAKPSPSGLSLLEVAERDNHPTFGAIIAHGARKRAHDLINEMDDAKAGAAP